MQNTRSGPKDDCQAISINPEMAYETGYIKWNTNI